MKYFWTFCAMASLILLDVWSKTFFQHFLLNHDIVIWKDLTLRLAFNPGIAFSLPLQGILQIFVTLALLGVLSWYFFRHYKNFPLLPTSGFVFIMSGALGNFYERLIFQKVTDFIQVFSWFPIFNLADIFVFVGVCIFFMLEWKQNS